MKKKRIDPNPSSHGIFAEVRSRVTTEEAAAFCGLKPDRSGYIRCPFHDDKHPSMKVYPDGFHCFSCGKHTDAVGLTAHCKGISPYAAAQALLRFAGFAHDPAAAQRTLDRWVSQHQKAADEHSRFQSWEKQTFLLLRNYRFLLLKFREKYRPAIGDHDTSAIAPFLLSIHHLDRVEEFLRILTQGTQEERYDMYQNSKEVIDEYTRLYEEYRGFRA